MLSHFSHVWLFATLWTVACLALSMGFSRQEYWTGLPCPPLEIFPTQGSNPSLISFALASRFFTWEAPTYIHKSTQMLIYEYDHSKQVSGWGRRRWCCHVLSALMVSVTKFWQVTYKQKLMHDSQKVFFKARRCAFLLPFIICTNWKMGVRAKAYATISDHKVEIA